MPKPLSHHALLLSRELHRLEVTRRKVERLNSKRLLTTRDAQRMYEGLFMKLVVSLESSLEEAFIAILSGRVVYNRRTVTPMIESLSRSTAVSLVLSGKSYVDWLPFENTEKRAKVFFKEGRPFTSLSPSQRTSLAQVSMIRNAIAHPSASAQAQFEKHVLANIPLTASEKSPAGFLRSIYRSSPDETRFEQFSAACLDVTQTIYQ